MSSVALNPLVEKVRSKYPGAYDDMDDATLTKKLLAKYPQYSDLAAPALSNPVKPQELPMSGMEQAGANATSGLVGGGDMLANTALKAGNQLYESSTPHIAQQIYKKIKGQPNELDKVPEHAVLTFLGMGGIPEAEAAEASAGTSAEVAAPPRPPMALKAGQYEAPASTLAPPKQLSSGPIDGEYLEEPAAAAKPAQAAAPKPKTAPIERDATLNKRNIPEYAGEDYGDLKQATADVVDKAIPPSADRATNLMTKAQVDLKLRNGDVAGAEQALDAAAKKSTPSYMSPDRPSIVPSTNNIRENEAMVASAEKSQTRGYREAQDDAGVAQEMRADLDKHGYRAESEARREFIARNSTGVTKGSMAKPNVPQPADDLQSQLQKMLDAARALKK